MEINEKWVEVNKMIEMKSIILQNYLKKYKTYQVEICLKLYTN